MNLNEAVDKAYQHLSLKELAKAPVAALSGVSDADAELLYQAFRIKTIEDLARLKYVRWAQAIVDLGDAEGE